MGKKKAAFAYPPLAGQKGTASPTGQTPVMPKPMQSRRPGGGALGKPPPASRPVARRGKRGL